ncbi:MAG: hypothetical protein K6U74_17400, partial [Firmicutes bacterium]|nr:hypothetical protein [Bacillota bacterium]
IQIRKPRVGDNRFKQWAKLVEKVDTSKANGFAFEGRFLNSLDEVDIGAYILAYGECGSRRRRTPVAALFRVKENGELEKIFEEAYLPPQWALAIRDRVASIIEGRGDPGQHPAVRELKMKRSFF